MADADVTLKVGLDAKDVQSQAKQLQGKIENIFDKTDGKKMSSSFVRLKQSMRDVYTQSKQVGAQLDELKKQQVVPMDTPAYTKTKNNITKIEAELDKLKVKIEEAKAMGADERYVRLSLKEGFLQSRLKEEKNLKTSLENRGMAQRNVPVEDTQTYQRLVALQARLNDKMQTGAIRAQEMSSKLANVRNVASQVANAFNTFSRGVAKVLSLMGRLVKYTASFIGHLRGMRSGSDDASKSFKNMLKFALKYGLGLRSIFILYKRIRSAGVEAYKGLASQFPELQAEINDLKNSFFQLKNSLATMAQPILSYLVPAIKTLVSWLTAAMNAIANFFAVLTGAKYIYKASKANKDWAKSAGGAGKAAKKANEDIAEYDNLMLIQQDNDNGGGGGGGAADDYAGAFEKVKAESDLAKEIKDAINRGDWEGIGYALAKRLNKVQNIVDNWIQTKLRPQGTKWAKRIARILNGLTDGWDSAKFGQTVAHGLMAIADIIATFWETYDWNKLGKKIGTAITNLFLNWEPKTVARFLARKFNALGKFLLGLTDDKEGINFALVGKKLGETIKNTFETIKWKDLGRGISKFIRGLFTSIRTAIQESDLGNTIATAFNDLLEGLDFKNMMSDLAKTANALIKALGDAIKNANWEDIGDGIATLITEINWTEVFKTVIITAQKMLTIAQKIITAIGDAISEIDWDEIGQAIADLLASIDWGQLIVTLIKVATGLIKGLGTALLKIASDPAALASLGTGLLAIFGAKWLWNKVKGAITGGLSGALTAGAGGVNWGLLGKGVAVVASYKLGTKIGAELGKAIFGPAFEEEYQKMIDHPVQYTIEAVQTIRKAASEASELTGGTTLGNAWKDLWSGGEYTQSKLDEFTKQQEKAQEAAYDKYLDMVRRRYNAGKKINDYDKQLLIERGLIQAKETKMSEANAYRQEMIAKHKAGVITDAEMQEIKAMTDAGVIAKKRRDEAITSSNHYAKIAQQNAITHQTAAKAAENAAIHHAEIAKKQAGVVSDSQKAMIATSNSYAKIAQENAQKHVNSQKAMSDAAESHATIAKQQAGVYAKAQQENINSSQHYAKIAQDNAKKVIDSNTDMATSSQHYVDIAKTGASDVSTASTTMATNVENSVKGIPTSFDTTFTSAYGAITGAFSATDTFFNGVASGVKKPFSTMGDFFKSTFTNAWTGVTNVFKTNSPQFQSIQDSVSTTFKGAINSMITGINNSLLSPFSTLSSAFSKLKGFSINGASPFSSLPSFNIPRIPRLAQGAVLPPNSPFLAVVGDQKQGTNIETPLGTMVDAFRQALAEYGGNNQPIILNLNGKQVAQAVWDEENKRYKQTGQRFKYS